MSDQIPDDESGSSGKSHTPWHLIIVVAHLIIIPIVLVILQDSPQRPPQSVQLIKSDPACQFPPRVADTQYLETRLAERNRPGDLDRARFGEAMMGQ